MNALATIEFDVSRQFDDGIPRVRDLDLAVFLGYAEPKAIRRLIRRWDAELGSRVTVSRLVFREKRGAKAETDEYLTRDQALFIVLKSETDRALELTQIVIKVFGKVLDGDLNVRPQIDAFRDRLDLPAPPGPYFSVLQEGARTILSMERAGLQVGPDCVPDISIGIAWAKRWEELKLEETHGPRVRWSDGFRYPPGYPQRAAQAEPWVYPIAALGEFVWWLRDIYEKNNLPRYLAGKGLKLLTGGAP